MPKQKRNQHSNPDHKVDKVDIVVDGQFVLARVSFDPLLLAEVLLSSQSWLWPTTCSTTRATLGSEHQCSGAGIGAVHYGSSVLPLLVTDLQVWYNFRHCWYSTNMC